MIAVINSSGHTIARRQKIWSDSVHTILRLLYCMYNYLPWKHNAVHQIDGYVAKRKRHTVDTNNLMLHLPIKRNALNIYFFITHRGLVLNMERTNRDRQTV